MNSEIILARTVFSRCPCMVSHMVWKWKRANFQRIFLWAPRSRKGSTSCLSTDWVRFWLFPSTVWIGRQYSLDFLHWNFWIFSSAFFDFLSRFSLHLSKEIAPKMWSFPRSPGGEKCAESCHVSGCHGFFGPEKAHQRATRKPVLGSALSSERAKGAEKASCGESVVQNLILDSPFFLFPLLSTGTWVRSRRFKSYSFILISGWLKMGWVSWDQLFVSIALKWKTVVSHSHLFRAA